MYKLFKILTMSASLALGATEASAFDMDCKVILCLPGGFPANCGDAKAYMISRITRFPNPLPPFGFCPMSNGEQYTGYHAPYRYLNTRSPDGWHCAAPKKLHFRLIDEDDGPSRVDAFCYDSVTTETYGRDDNVRNVYHGKSAANPVNFQIQITIEPGTPVESRSPTFKLNYNTGYFVPVQ